MCQETLDTFNGTEFWYVDQGLVVADENNHNPQKALPHRRDDKWWLPIPKVPNEGLSKDCTKQLQHQRECINQILKAAVAINTQILSEMEIPELYFDALPKVVFKSYRLIIFVHSPFTLIFDTYKAMAIAPKDIIIQMLFVFFAFAKIVI